MQTAYIRNLNENISLKKLKDGLASFFDKAGYPVEEVQAWRKISLRGQAFVVFKNDVDISKIAEELNTEMLFDKPVHIQPAKTESDVAVVKSKSVSEYEKYLNESRRKRQMMRQKGKDTVIGSKRTLETDESLPQPKKQRHIETTPNRMMILTELPPAVKQVDVDVLFGNFKGFLSATHVAARRLALVEFQTEVDAVTCYKSLGSTPEIQNKKCVLSYAKK